MTFTSPLLLRLLNTIHSNGGDWTTDYSQCPPTHFCAKAAQFLRLRQCAFPSEFRIQIIFLQGTVREIAFSKGRRALTICPPLSSHALSPSLLRGHTAPGLTPARAASFLGKAEARLPEMAAMPAMKSESFMLLNGERLITGG